MLLLETNANNSTILAKNSIKPYFIPERITTLDLLKIFQQKGLYLAFVIDEYRNYTRYVNNKKFIINSSRSSGRR